MQKNNISSVQDLFQQMSTEELRELLDKELHSETVNDDAIRLIMGILRERNKAEVTQVPPQTLKAWEKYQRDTDRIYAPARRAIQLRRWIARGAAAAAVLLLFLLPVMPQEAGAESLWETLTRWTTEVMEFFGYHDNEDRLVTYEFKTDNPGLQQVYDKAVELGITVPVVPMWLPEGYELVECRVAEYPAKTRLYSRFANVEDVIVLNFDLYKTEVSRKYQKNEIGIEMIEIDGVEHFLFANLDNKVMVWERDKIECSVSLQCQEEILYEIIQSIYSVGGNK